MADATVPLPRPGAVQGYTKLSDESYAPNVAVVTAAATSDIAIPLPFLGGELAYKLQSDGTYAMCVVSV